MVRLVGLLLTAALATASLHAQTPEWGDAPEATGYRWEYLHSGINRPWGLAFLPRGNMLVTQRGGQLLMISSSGVRQFISGVPRPYVDLHCGLWDVAVHPNFARNNFVYLTMSVGTFERNRVELYRGVLSGSRLINVRRIFASVEYKGGPEGSGGRMCWLPDGTLLVGVNDGGSAVYYNGAHIMIQAQNLANHFGKIMRIRDDGTVPPDNPYVGVPGAMPEIWSIGHRNPSGLCYDSIRRQVINTEHGPKGGDEANVVVRGGNFGWPVVTHGVNYDGTPISTFRTKPGYIDPLAVWTPSIGIAGAEVYTGPHFPQWRGSVFVAALRGLGLRRIDRATDGTVTGQGKLELGLRVRQVKQGPDGYLYAVTDEVGALGGIFRIVPAPAP